MNDAFRPLSRRAALALPLALAGCQTLSNLLTPTTKRLPGKREAILPVRNGLALDAAPGTTVALPAAAGLAEWLQPGAGPTHALGSLAGPGGWTKRWQADIGTGNGYRRKLVVQPLVTGGRVFTMDVDGVVEAFTLDHGDFLWQFDPAPDATDSTNVGGGLSSDGQRLYVSTGYGDLIALDPATARLLWRVALGAPARSAATVADGTLYLITLDARLLAYDTGGSLIWTYQGMPAATAAISVSAPAVDGEVVAAAFSSGELVAVDRRTGTEIWTDSLSASRTLLAASDIAAVTAPPVIAAGKVFAIGLGGLMLAVDLRSGRRVWERDIGGFEMPCVVGGIAFVYGDGHLLALTRDEGTALWIAEIPPYRNMKRQSGPITWHGPVLVGGQLWMASDQGEMLPIDPAQGNLGKPVNLGERVALAPIIAGDRWIIEFESGAVAAFG